MTGTINNLAGVEEDDIPYHLSLLDFQGSTDNVLFYALNDTHGTHSEQWHLDIIKKSKSFDKVVFYDLVNHGDDAHDTFCNIVKGFDHPNKIYLTNNFNLDFVIDGVSIVRWHYMWNRTRAYYVDRPNFRGPDTPFLHHYAGLGNYTVPDINYNNRSKLFLNLCARKLHYRTQLYEHTCQFQDQGYISYWAKGLIIGHQAPYLPIPNTYYTDSYFSVYVESNCESPDLIHITEKTFEPLIKGHFILPFANPGSIQHIQSLGFKLPEFIDYSYDTVFDTQQRFKLFIQEFKRLLTLDWQKVYHDNIDCVLHNQQCLYSLPYDDSILQIFQ